MQKYRLNASNIIVKGGNNMTAKISVIMSVYNAENYVGQAIDSILNQTFTEFEFLILDDGSGDSSWDIISAYTDSRIFVFKQQNQGINASRNFLIQRATADFIALLDADDIAMPDRLQQQYDYMQQNPTCAVVGMRAEKFGTETGILNGFNSKFINKIADDIIYNNRFSVVNPCAFMRQSMLSLLSKPIYKTKTLSEDMNLWLRLSYIGRIDNIDTIGIKYRIHKNSYSYDKQAVLKQSVFFSIVAVYEQYKNNTSDSQLTEYDIDQDKSLQKIRKKYNLLHPIWGAYMYYCKPYNTMFNRLQRACIYVNYRLQRFFYTKKRK